MSSGFKPRSRSVLGDDGRGETAHGLFRDRRIINQVRQGVEHGDREAGRLAPWPVEPSLRSWVVSFTVMSLPRALPDLVMLDAVLVPVGFSSHPYLPARR